MGALVMSTTYNRPGASLVRSPFSGDLRFLPVTFAFSTSYATGGDTGLVLPPYKDIVSPYLFGGPSAFTLKVDAVNLKMQAFAATVTAHTEVTAATNLSTILGTITAFVLVRL